MFMFLREAESYLFYLSYYADVLDFGEMSIYKLRCMQISVSYISSFSELVALSFNLFR